MKLRSGAHVDRIVDINPGATLSVAQHNASSPLLRLPLEVENLIYKYTFGGNLVHITQDPDEGATKFNNTICRALISEEEAQDNFDEETIHKCHVPANEDRHSCCRFREQATFGDGEQKLMSLRLSALRCCRQIYNEAHYIPYSANTFACVDPDTLQGFVRSLTKGNHEDHLAVRSLFLELVFDGVVSQSDWRMVLNTCAKLLKNVNNVNISIEWCCWYQLFTAGNDAAFKANWLTPLMSKFLVLKKLPLKSATLIVSDRQAIEYIEICQDQGVLPTSSRTRGPWTLKKKREWALSIKELILN